MSKFFTKIIIIHELKLHQNSLYMIKGNVNDIKLNDTWVVKVIINLTVNPHKIN